MTVTLEHQTDQGDWEVEYDLIVQHDREVNCFQVDVNEATVKLAFLDGEQIDVAEAQKAFDIWYDKNCDEIGNELTEAVIARR